jgi:cobalt/nickel transport system permease protein
VNPFPIDAYAYANRLRWAHPAEKIIFALVTVVICLVSRSPLVCLLALLWATLEVTVLGGIPLRAYWYFIRVPVGFIFTGVITLAVIGLPAGAPDALLAFSLGPWEFGVTAASLGQAAQVFLTSFAAVGITLGMALTTPMVDITEQLRRWHVPQLFVELMTLIYRFIFVLLETAQAMRTAQEARLGYSSWRRWLRSVGMLASNLFLRANTRAMHLFTALSARGYTGDLKVLQAQPVWSRRNIALIAAADGLLLVLAVGLKLGGLA